MIDLKNRIVFVHIPKTAGSAVEKYFLDIRGLEKRNQAALAMFKNLKTSDLERGNQHNTLEMYETFFFGGEIPSDFRVFTVVRDPYKRFWSEWRSRRLPPPKSSPVSFHLSVRQLVRLTEKPVSALKDLNSHMYPQVSFTRGKSSDRLRVLRFESLAEDFAAMCADWGLPDRPLPRVNEARRDGEPSAADLAFGNAFVRARYQEDFDAFGYSPDI